MMPIYNHKIENNTMRKRVLLEAATFSFSFLNVEGSIFLDG